jgi:hypothetical protein
MPFYAAADGSSGSSQPPHFFNLTSSTSALPQEAF